MIFCQEYSSCIYGENVMCLQQVRRWSRVFETEKKCSRSTNISFQHTRSISLEKQYIISVLIAQI